MGYYDGIDWKNKPDHRSPLNAANLEIMDTELVNLDGAVYYDEFLINGGEYTIKASDLESGQWSYSTKAANSARARSKILFPVHAGTEVTYSNTTFDVYFGVMETPTSQSYIAGQYGWKTNASGTFKITADGYMTFIIRNHDDTSATVNPAAFNSVVTIKTKNGMGIKKLLANQKYNFNNLVDSLDNIFYANGESNGINYTWNDGECTANGTATGYAINTFLNRDALPSNVNPGDNILVDVTSTDPNNLSFRILFIDGNNTVLATEYIVSPRLLVVPQNTTKWSYQTYVAPNKTVNNAKISNFKVFAPIDNVIKNDLLVWYKPSSTPFSVWDMPTNSWYYGAGSTFKASIDVGDKISSATSYHIIRIGDWIFVSSPFVKQYFIGAKLISSGTQYWHDLSGELFSQRGIVPDNTDFDDITQPGYYLVLSSHPYSNSPLRPGYAGILLVFPGNDNFILQIAVEIAETNPRFYYRTSLIGTFPEDWVDLSGDGGTIINNYYDSFENTYNITCTPTITTDTNNYLASTGDSTDRTGDIQTMLNTTGVCHLGPGDFYVTGVDIPTYGLLIGSGNKTRLVLASSVTNGYAVRLKTNGCVKQMLIDGNPAGTQITRPSEVGSRHGIYFQGTADAQSGAVTYYRSAVENCMIRNFTGGGITCHNTGLSPASSLVVSDCHIYWSGAGINVSYYSEFHRFTNITSQQNLYGCINNGGNCNFANCDFSSNTQGLLIDNRASQSPNNSHGSFVGCTFNHSDNNTGIAIQILGAANGEIFTAPQIFYGAIDIENSYGIRIVGANIGRAVPITVKNSTVVTFADCNMYSASESGLTQSGNTRLEFKDCYNRDGSVYDPLA